MNKRYPYILACCALFAAFSSLYGQSNTRGKAEDTLGRVMPHSNNSSPDSHKILVVPFNSTMCMSEIDKDVNKVTHEDYKHITEDFRRELDLAVYNAAHQDAVSISLLQGKYKSDSILSYIYGSTSYKYDLVPGTKADAGAAPDTGKKSHYIHNGQLEVPVDYSQRFMNVSIQNPKLLPFLNQKYGADVFVFINELDIKNVNNATEDLTADTYRRQITVHYSVLDKDAHALAKGVASTYFPFRENDPKVISEKYFTVIAHSIMKEYKQGLEKKNNPHQTGKQGARSKSTANSNK